MSEAVETTIWVCQYDNCLRRRSQAVLAAFNQIELPAGTTVVAGNCQGQCHIGPNVMVVRRSPIDLGSSGDDLRSIGDHRPLWYCEVKPEDAEEIIQSPEPIQRLLNPRLHFY